MKPEIRIDDFDYTLPEDRIAKFPLEHRDDSKLLVNIDGNFKEEKFVNIADYLPENSFMVFNETKVVPARLFFKKDTGAIIEVFCLEPALPEDYELSFAQTEKCSWKVIVGNVKRWKSGLISLYSEHIDDPIIKEIDLKAELKSRNGNTAIVEFTWSGGYSFSKVMALCGNIPIPPYLNRETQEIDLTRYQTSYARLEGSVAAPTAGLHFTEMELKAIDLKGIKRSHLCLHVGAGTFLPVKSEFISDHLMHSEPFSVTLQFLKDLAISAENKNVIAVGTTSTRTLESLYYLGVHCLEGGEPGFVEQWEPYREEGYNYSAYEAVSALVKYLENNKKESITSRTSLIIVPSCKLHIIDYIVTNFHQPKSTLLLLISALIGDSWRDMYQFALDHDFRFLSYGDSSLLKKQF